MSKADQFREYAEEAMRWYSVEAARMFTRAAVPEKQDPRRGLPILRRGSCRWVSPDGGSDVWRLNA